MYLLTLTLNQSSRVQSVAAFQEENAKAQFQARYYGFDTQIDLAATCEMTTEKLKILPMVT